jgi:hypothetical protein
MKTVINYASFRKSTGVLKLKLKLILNDLEAARQSLNSFWNPLVAIFKSFW